MNSTITSNVFDFLENEIIQASTCLRRKYAAAIIDTNGLVVSYGTNSEPTGWISCKDLGYCIRDKKKIPRGTNYELCRSVHAEMNCIIKASYMSMVGSTIYLVGIDNNGKYLDYAEPCAICKRLIIQSKISNVVIKVGKDIYRTIDVNKDWILQSNVSLELDSYIEM